MRRSVLFGCLLTSLVSPLLLKGGCAQQAPAKTTRTQDVIYGHKGGEKLTMDVFAPLQNAKGIGIIWVVSGGWYASREAISVPISKSMINDLVMRGYTVFAVVPSSQPKFTIPEMLPDLQRAIRFIRYNATQYHIDPNHIGITGVSSGGHLALMQATSGDNGNPKAKDAIERVSSHIQAAACFFPPTDFLNYGEAGQIALGSGRLEGFPAPFAFYQSDFKKRLEVGRNISPINHVTPDDPPTLIIHGSNDQLVPIQQGKMMIAKLKEARVPAQLITKAGAAHGWDDIDSDISKLADWFDKYLLKK